MRGSNQIALSFFGKLIRFHYHNQIFTFPFQLKILDKKKKHRTKKDQEKAKKKKKHIFLSLLFFQNNIYTKKSLHLQIRQWQFLHFSLNSDSLTHRHTHFNLCCPFHTPIFFPLSRIILSISIFKFFFLLSGFSRSSSSCGNENCHLCFIETNKKLLGFLFLFFLVFF